MNKGKITTEQFDALEKRLFSKGTMPTVPFSEPALIQASQILFEQIIKHGDVVTLRAWARDLLSRDPLNTNAKQYLAITASNEHPRPSTKAVTVDHDV